MGRTPRSVYVSGPLHSAPDLAAARAFYEHLGAVCEAHGLEAYLPHRRNDPELHPEVDPHEVWRTDYSGIRGASAVVAHIGVPSSGVGAELAIAHEHAIPIIAIRRAGEDVSRFIAGLLEEARATLVVADDQDEIAARLGEALDALGAHRPVPVPVAGAGV